jgi:hypothetical protein
MTPAEFITPRIVDRPSEYMPPRATMMSNDPLTTTERILFIIGAVIAAATVTAVAIGTKLFRR